MSSHSCSAWCHVDIMISGYKCHQHALHQSALQLENINSTLELFIYCRDSSRLADPCRHVPTTRDISNMGALTRSLVERGWSVQDAAQASWHQVTHGVGSRHLPDRSQHSLHNAAAGLL